MESDRLLELAAAAPVARLATVTPQGLPHLVPITFAVVGPTLYTAVDSKPKRTTRLQRLTNIDSNGTAEVLVDNYSDDWEELWWVRFAGPARVARSGPDLERALDSLVAKYHQYASRPPTGPAIVIDIVSTSTWSYS